MAIQEGKLDDIVGSGKFHSALVSTFTIDPIYVKHIFVPVLQSKRIRNITILADQSEMERALSEEENLLRLADPSFLIIPAKASTLFHPKVMLFIGEKEGLCVIGSGNLTHSGMGGNNEIWGAFHYSPDNDQHTHIFFAVWNFLRRYMPELTGTGDLKNGAWITHYASWLNEILSGSFDDSSTPTAVFTNSDEETIWSNLNERLKGKDISEVLIASPYYDERGIILHELKNMYPSAMINMIYDKQGTIPKISETFDNLNCYAWQEVSAHSGKEFISGRRLHAKFILFREKSGHEHLLFGSANATQAGLGITNSGTPNVELSLFANNSSKRYSHVLGIHLDGLESTPVSEITVDHEALLEEPSGIYSSNTLKVVYAEQTHNTVTLVLNKINFSESIRFVFFDKNGSETHEEKIDRPEQNVLEIKLPTNNSESDIEKVFFVAIKDRPSKTIIYHAKTLSLGNPDSRAELIRHTLSDIGSVDFGSLHGQFMKIFREFVENKEITSGEKHSSSQSTEKNDDARSISDKFLRKEEFTEKKRAYHTVSSDRFINDGILGILNALNQQLNITDKVETSAEALAKDGSIDSEFDEDEIEKLEEKLRKKSRDETKKQIDGYRSYFKRVLRFYDKFVKTFDENGSNQLSDETIINEHFISNWLLVTAIAVHIILNDAKTEASSSSDYNSGTDLDKKTTILPYQDEKEISINDIVSKIIPRIVGRLTLAKIELSKMLDRDQRIDAVVNLILLVHLQHWKERERDKFLRLCTNALELFELDGDIHLSEFKNRFIVQTSPFLSTEVKENDWRYYSNFFQNFGFFMKHLSPEPDR